MTTTPTSTHLGKVAKQGVAWSFVREGVAEILFFPASMVLARMLTPREFGIAAAALFFVLLAARVGELGFNAALVRSKVVTPLHMSTVYSVNLLMGVCSFLALTIAAPAIGHFYQVPEIGRILPVAALAFLITPLGSVPASWMAREMKFREKTLVDWAQGLTFAGGAVVLAWMEFSFWSLVYARLAGAVVQTGGVFYFSDWRPSLRFSYTAFREIVTFAAGVQTKRLIEYGAQNIDNLLVGKLMGMTALGIYDKAFSTMWRVLGRMNSGGPGVMFRVFALIQEDPTRFRRAYGKVVMSTSLIGLPVFAVLAVVAPQLMLALFGPQWGDAAAPFQVLCGVGVLKLLDSYASAAIQAAGYVWSEVWRLVFNIALLIVLIAALRHYGPLGAASGVLVATLFTTILMHGLLRRVTRLTWMQLLEPLLPAILCATGCSVVGAIVELSLKATTLDSPWLLLMMQTSATAAFWVLFALFTPHRALRTLMRDVGQDLAPSYMKRIPWVRNYLRDSSVQAESTRT